MQSLSFQTVNSSFQRKFDRMKINHVILHRFNYEITFSLADSANSDDWPICQIWPHRQGLYSVLDPILTLIVFVFGSQFCNFTFQFKRTDLQTALEQKSFVKYKIALLILIDVAKIWESCVLSMDNFVKSKTFCFCSNSLSKNYDHLGETGSQSLVDAIALSRIVQELIWIWTLLPEPFLYIVVEELYMLIKILIFGRNCRFWSKL